ncbi:hypothetical protein Avbf_13483 [Armadillidium vulgare]|nr:hypothetical protein Avbf_13483 [Armadillidium vulgare]
MISRHVVDFWGHCEDERGYDMGEEFLWEKEIKAKQNPDPLRHKAAALANRLAAGNCKSLSFTVWEFINYLNLNFV